MKLSKSEGLILTGSMFIVVCGLLTALVPALAYVTAHTYFLDIPNPPYDLPYIRYMPLEFSLHIYSVKFIMAALSGSIGLLAFAKKKILPYAAVAVIVLVNLSLMIPAASEMRLTFPEM